MQSYPVDAYQIGIICALPKELKAVRAILDETHEPLKSKDGQDHNSYILGRIGQHNVVAAGLPAGVYGTTSAASVGKDMLRTFSNLRFGLLVGIAGGIPNIHARRDVRLGDVVVSQPDATHGGVVQYDLGRHLDNGQFVRKGVVNKPPQTLLTALTNMQADLNEDDPIVQCLFQVDKKHPSLRDKGYCYQDSGQDQLHCATCDPSRWWWTLWMFVVWLWPLWRCSKCDQGKVSRQLRHLTTPVIHYGTIASGNTLLKDATQRDQIGKDLGALCVEMEAAGLNDYPCLVIRGICDYADAHKNDVWQEYAALTAAAFSKVFLGYVSPQEVMRENPIQQVLDQLDQHLQHQHEHNTRIEEHNRRQEIHYYNDRYRGCHRAFAVSDYERQKNINANAIPGTCRWVLDHPRYQQWSESATGDLLWISADPGCGKSVLSRSLADDWLISKVETTMPQISGKPNIICYFFFKDNEEQSSLATALCAILHQLFSHQPELLSYALPSFEKNGESLTKKVDELWRLLKAAVTDTAMQPIVCVLDALDECRDADRQLLIDLICRSYRESISSIEHRWRLKWLVTSRPNDDIQGCFGRLPPDLPSIRLRGEDENDQIRNEINLVIDQRMLDMGNRLGLKDAKRQEVTQQLRDMDNRTYLWLYLVLEHIEVAFRRSPRPNQVTIPSLPATVNQAYENILKRVEDVEEKRYAKVVLTIIVGAPRPLTIAEMALAFDVATLPRAPRSLADLTVEVNGLGDKIRRWCGLFVFVNHDRLYLIHQTAKEFLQSNSNELVLDTTTWKQCLRPMDIDREMAKICVIFLCLSEFDDTPEIETSDETVLMGSTSVGDDRPVSEAFFAFASEHWAGYVRRVEADLDNCLQSRIRLLYDSTSERYRRWTSTFVETNFANKDVAKDNVSLASFNGHCLVLQRLLSNNPGRFNQVDQHKRTPLAWAAAGGHKETVELFLARPTIDVNLGHPLYMASVYRHNEVVKLLLARPDIDVNLGQPLKCLACRGYNETIELLLAHPAIDVNFVEPLQHAASLGHKETVELLLGQPGIDVNLGRPLAWAASRKYKQIVKLLLAHPDIDVNLGKPLYRAVKRGHKEIVKLLLAHPKIDTTNADTLKKVNRLTSDEAYETNSSDSEW